MTQVLHVLSTEASFQPRRGAEALRCDPANVFGAGIKTIGRGGTWRSVPFAVHGLHERRYDVVHAWDYQSLLAAVVASCPKIVFTPPSPATRHQSRLLRVILRRREIALICDSDLAHRMWIGAGVPSDHCHLIRPGVELNGVNVQRDPALRTALGFNETDHVVLAVGESTHAAQHNLSVWAVSILHVSDRSERLVLWGRGRAWRSALRPAIRFDKPEWYSVAEAKLRRSVEFEELCSIADLALVTADHAVATLPIAICMARGIPIVASRSPIVSEMLEDGVSARIVPKFARQIARGIVELRASPASQKTLSTNAMEQARDRFALSRFIAQHRQLYTRTAAGETADVSCPGMPPPVNPPDSERFVTS